MIYKFTSLFLFFTHLAIISLAQNEDTIIWKNDSENTVTYDLAKEKNFDNLKIKLKGIKPENIDSIRFDSSKPVSRESLKLKINDIDKSSAEQMTVLSLKNYLEKSYESKNYDQFFSINEVVQIKITIFSNKDEEMDIKLDIKPSTILSRNNSFLFIPPPLPNITSINEDTLNWNKTHRVLLLDGSGHLKNRGFQIVSFSQDTSFATRRQRSLVVNKSLSIISSNINLDSLQSIKFSLNGTEYKYDAGVADIYKKQTELPKTNDLIETASVNGDKAILSQSEQIKNYFKSTFYALNKVKYFNIVDYRSLQAFKQQLKKSVVDASILLDEESFNYYFHILNYQPQFINLTPFSLTVPNADEVAVEATIKYGSKGIEEKYNTGVFRTSRSLAVHVGSSLFITGLRNNNVFTRINESGELRAVMDQDNQLSLGIGVNSEISYRTGYMFRPNFNLAFFVPFAEDITPFVGIGPGFSFTDRNVSLNISGGMAFGKVNAIAEQYRNVDLNSLPDLTNTSLIQKVWDGDWYISIGVGFKLNSQEN
ncbi:hypothetical protein [Anditalea andensis]|nr:hypothetical protein [Anditalea andensis]